MFGRQQLANFDDGHVADEGDGSDGEYDGGADATAASLGLGSASISTSTDASSMLATLDTAINSVNSSRGTLGAQQNRLESTLRSLANVRENTSAAESRIRDVDVAFETADLTRNSILQQAATSVLAQANAQPQLALSLLG